MQEMPAGMGIDEYHEDVRNTGIDETYLIVVLSGD